MKKIIFCLFILLVTTDVFSAVFPKEMSNKKIFVMDGKDVRYTSLWTLGLFIHGLNEGAIKNNGQLKVFKSISSYVIQISSADTDLKLSIDNNNVLTNLSIKRGIESFSFNSTMHHEMVTALSFLLPFNDKVEKNIELQKRKAADKEATFVRDNMLNFEYHMPLFAGLTWGDEFADGLKKLKKVNGISEVSGDCHLDEKVFGRDVDLLTVEDEITGRGDSPTKKITDILKKEDLLTITDDEAKTVTGSVDGCTVRGKIVLFNTPCDITLHFGVTSFGTVVPYYLNHISIKGNFGANHSKLLEAYQSKYKSFKVKKYRPETEREDRFGSSIDFGASYGGDNAIEYFKSNDISDLQQKIMTDEENLKASEEYKDAAQANDAI